MEKETEYAELFANPYIPDERGFIDEVIKPKVTRRKLNQAQDSVLLPFVTTA